ncbi:MAG: hypothetical protein ABTD50_19325 [Polyangiaceae bacterium]
MASMKLREQAATFCQLAATATDETLLQVVTRLQAVPHGYEGPTPFERVSPFLDAVTKARVGALVHRELAESGVSTPTAKA